MMMPTAQNSTSQTYFAHSQAIVDPGAVIGFGTKIWAFAHVLSTAVIGEDCNVCDHTFVEGGVIIGNRVTLKCGVYLWDGITVEDDVFIGPNATFTNDLRPRSKQYPDEFLKTRLSRGCSVGANATILPGLTIGQWAMIAAGSVVTKNVPDFALVAGNPARQLGWVCQCGKKLKEFAENQTACTCGLSYQARPDQTESNQIKVNPTIQENPNVD